ncbi:MAG: lysine--tRNA ligase [Candidatus Chisholmbacteria bacterium RIFCSPHIGHO2_01_FULL_48_12]|uniref:Lysine--tRNA ligase n=1 Tax=Candidatus Chisholmbacteria bacterium RIFCSPHIGHO2_01_FULL_48_12 TaxID=1797589 RepID=A0A1G1VJM5_9BACT|nr:MAG: lysine--tRNA ligase [Candidatus Chisholmbacteria bacterium RIFCSPHIGHO2_01_FULL_48_12]
MHWADELITKIPHRQARHRVDDMKTVSGMPHVGSLRAIVTHDILYRAMRKAGFKVDFTYVFNDMDPMDGLPVYLPEAKYRQHMGKPLYQIPAPEPGYASFGEYYALKYQAAFNKIGCHPKIIWSHELYAKGQMDELVRIALDNTDKIRRIYSQVAKQTKPDDWHPYQVICPQCGKVGTTIVTAWDGKYVTYECRANLVQWAQGCGHEARVEPVGENGKLMWKVDWPAHWKALQITVECAGKDHFSAGGSRDLGVHICQEVFGVKPPTGWLHEFFLVGGKKMSSSKGAGVGADEITSIIPPELIRFLIARTPIRKAVNFDPEGMSIPDLYDAYDQAAQAYWDKSDEKMARTFELSQVSGQPAKKHFLPRFRDVATVVQYPEIDNYVRFAQVKGAALTELEKNVLEDRVKYAQIWLDGYSPAEAVFKPADKLPQAAGQLTELQQDYLRQVRLLLTQEWKEPEELQQALYDAAKKLQMPTEQAFGAIYLTLIGKTHGPRAAWLLLEHLSKAKKLLKEASAGG